MVNLLDIANNLACRTGNRFVADSAREITELVADYSSYTDDELRAECQRALAGQIREYRDDRYLIQRIVSFVLGLRQADPSAIKHVALGVAVFKRAPADLPSRSALFPQQVHAAVALTNHALVQMNTGEGKTYALLPAAFSLACSHERVYIVCANQYLAHRDAERTRPFWDLLGIPLGVCLNYDDPPEHWSQRVIYTTLSALIFKVLSDEGRTSQPIVPVTFSAIVLDEADAILLDQTTAVFSLTVPIKGDAFDWSFAIATAAELTDEDISVDNATFQASLTLAGERKFKDILVQQEPHRRAYFLERHIVEISYIATRVAIEDEDYIVQADRIHQVDRLTGRVRPDQTPDWLFPLEFSKGMRRRDKQVRINSISPRVFLNSFRHLSGLSGTVEDDALEYLFSYQLPTLTIPPRRDRQTGLEIDMVSMSRTDAMAVLVEMVKDARDRGQPVLVGTQTIADAQDVHRIIQSTLPDATGLTLLTGKNEEQAAEYFREAGEAGSILVTTQLAGRGVDIRLSDQARASGGLALFCLSHALEMRHDKQFLGRAGRQGDPYSARFLCSLEDSLMRRFSSPETSKGLLAKVGMKPGEVIESALLVKQINKVQRMVRRHYFQRRRNAQWLYEPESEIRTKLRQWFSYLQIPAPEDQSDETLSSDFIEWVVEHFIDARIQFLNDREISLEEAENIIAAFKDALGFADDTCPVRVIDIEGGTTDAVTNVIRKKLLDLIADVEVERNALQHLLKERAASLRAEISICDDGIDLLDVESRADGTGESGMSSEPTEIADNQTVPHEPASHSEESEFVSPGQLAGPAFDPIVAQELSKGLAEIQSELDRSYSDLESIVQRIGELIDRHSSAWIAREREIGDQVVARLRTRREAAIHNLVSNIQSSSKLSSRSPRAIAHAILRNTWSEFLEEIDRIKFQSTKRNLSGLDYYRVVTDRMTTRWANTESSLSGEILKGLFKASSPEQLDELFFVDDYRGNTIRDSAIDSSLSPSKTPKLLAQDERQNRIEELIQQFTSSVAADIRDADFDASKLRRLLSDFFTDSPLTSLQTPGQIYTALDAWFQSEYDRGVKDSRRKTHRKWLFAFLQVLRERNAIGPLPDFRTRLVFSYRKILQNIGDPKSILPLVSGVILAAIMTLGWFFGDLSAPKELGPFLSHVDKLIFGGLLSTTNVVAGCLALPVLVRILANLSNNQDWALMLVTQQATILQGVLALCLAVLAANGFSFWEAAQAVVVFAAAFLLMGLARNAVSLVKTEIGIDVSSAWLCFTILFVFLPGAADSDVPVTSILSVAVSVATVTHFWSRFNTRDVTLVSQRISSGGGVIESERVETSATVRGSVGITPHAFGVIGAWLAYKISHGLLGVESATWSIVVSGGVYAMLFAWLTVAMLTRRCSVALWQENLNRRRQRIKGAGTDADMARVLGSVQRVLISREILCALLLFVAVLLLLEIPLRKSSDFPVFIMVFFGAAALGHLAGQFIYQSYRFFVSRTPHQMEELSLSQLPRPVADKEKAMRSRKLTLEKAKWILGFVFLVYESAEWLIEQFGNPLDYLG